MYPTSRRTAAVAATLGVLAVLLMVKPDARHALLSRVIAIAGPRPDRITGQVVDATQHTAVSAASIVVTGTATGANTTGDGTFTLRLPPDAKTLTVRRIGYLAKTATIFPWQTDYTISLQPDVLRLEAQVVTGVATEAAAAPMRPVSPPLVEPSTARREMFGAAEKTGSDGILASDLSVGSTAADASRMIVRSGGASIEVTSIDSAIPHIRALASAIGGYVANSSVQAGHDQVRTAMLELKAPADQFDRLLSGLGSLGTVETVNVSAEDVGEEYVDVEARMANDHRLEERLIELLATRTGKLKDVLDVEQELARVREEIERYEGRLRFLRSHAELSTLNITAHEAVPIIDHVAPNPITAAARQAWRNFIGLVAFAIASLGVLIPLAAVGGGLWLFFRPTKPRTAEARS